MRSHTALGWILFVLFAAASADVVAEEPGTRVVYGMFGPRVLGAPLQPHRGSFGGGILVGPAGEFIGRAPRAGMMFPGSPWHYPSAGGPSPTYPPSALGAIRVRPLIPASSLPSGSSPVPEAGAGAPVSAPPPASDQWLRQPPEAAQ
ncbi:MAG: hypothetical protein ACLQNE_13215 [Thermoguttaceae bacterium]